MAKSIVGLVFGLVIGVYFTACYPEVAIRGLQRIHIPMLGPTAQPIEQYH